MKKTKTCGSIGNQVIQRCNKIMSALIIQDAPAAEKRKCRGFPVHPLSPIVRPEWDEQVLLRTGFRKVTIDRDIWKKVWTWEEKINYASTPMFQITAEK